MVFAPVGLIQNVFHSSRLQFSKVLVHQLFAFRLCGKDLFPQLVGTERRLRVIAGIPAHNGFALFLFIYLFTCSSTGSPISPSYIVVAVVYLRSNQNYADYGF